MTTPCSTAVHRRGSILALEFMRAEGIDVIGEVGDPDPYTATMDAVTEHHPSEIIISTYPETRSGWLRRDLDRADRGQRRASRSTHVVADPDTEGLPFHVTLAVANRTASGDELLDAARRRRPRSTSATTGRPRGQRVFIVVVPQEGGDGQATRRARTRLKLVLDRLHQEGMYGAGIVGDPDPYTAIVNALQYFRVDDIVISTFPETKSGWLRADLIERVRREQQQARRARRAQDDAAETAAAIGLGVAEWKQAHRSPTATTTARLPPTTPHGWRRQPSGCCFSSSPR